jgi:hypothetical protein
MTWFGWVWNTRRQRWERVCEVEGLSACSRRLSEILRVRNVKEKYATMTGGGVPKFRPAGRRCNDEATTTNQDSR